MPVRVNIFFSNCFFPERSWSPKIRKGDERCSRFVATGRSLGVATTLRAGILQRALPFAALSCRPCGRTEFGLGVRV